MGGLAQRAVATADDDQVDAAVHRPGQGVGQLGGVSDWLCVDQVEPGGAQLPAHGFVVAAAPARADIDHKCGSPVGPDVRVHGGLGAQLYRSLHAIHPLLLVIASARSRTYGCQKRRGRRGGSTRYFRDPPRGIGHDSLAAARTGVLSIGGGLRRPDPAG